MSLPGTVRSALTDDAASTWETIAPVLPAAIYLRGGTALAVHLAHRVSLDLDFFYHHAAVDLESLVATLERVGPFAVTHRAAGTLNGLFSQTRLQVLHADEVEPRRRLDPPQPMPGSTWQASAISSP